MYVDIWRPVNYHSYLHCWRMWCIVDPVSLWLVYMLLIGLLVVPVGRGPIIQSPPVQYGEHSQCHEC